MQTIVPGIIVNRDVGIHLFGSLLRFRYLVNIYFGVADHRKCVPQESEDNLCVWQLLHLMMHVVTASNFEGVDNQ